MIGEEAARNLRAGSTGDDVRGLQSMLNDRSDVATPLEVDGIFGPITDKAVRELQSANPPLKVDGIVGPLTRGVLAEPGPADSETLGRKVFERGVAAYERRTSPMRMTSGFERTSCRHGPSSCSTRARLCGGWAAGGTRRSHASRRTSPRAADSASSGQGAARRAARTRGDRRGRDRRRDGAGGVRARRGHDSARDFAHAYDEFTKSWELSHRPELLFNRAQALRMLGGREPRQFDLRAVRLERGGSRKEEARQHIKDLRGPAANRCRGDR